MTKESPKGFEHKGNPVGGLVNGTEYVGLKRKGQSMVTTALLSRTVLGGPITTSGP